MLVRIFLIGKLRALCTSNLKEQIGWQTLNLRLTLYKYTYLVGWQMNHQHPKEMLVGRPKP